MAGRYTKPSGRTTSKLGEVEPDHRPCYRACQYVAATKKKPALELPVMEFERPAVFRAWLSRNHAKSAGIWIRLAKKNSKLRAIDYTEAVDCALRWGWIDGQGRSYDADSWLQKFTPRRPRSVWSKINRRKALALIERGEMKAPGLAAIERARKNGSWDAAYDSPRSASIPEDLAQALAGSARAAKFFATLSSADRYAILWRLQTAKKVETRARRIEQFIAMLARGGNVHARKPKK
jgi:uncharacterized protein YdeI (YjbR/CyaY-like superfamily)